MGGVLDYGGPPQGQREAEGLVWGGDGTEQREEGCFYWL